MELNTRWQTLQIYNAENNYFTTNNDNAAASSKNRLELKAA